MVSGGVIRIAVLVNKILNVELEKSNWLLKLSSLRRLNFFLYYCSNNKI